MKASELRIGNLVILKKPFYTFKKGDVFNLSNVGVDYLDRWQDMGASECLKIEDIEPIPLTEEWLLKFGFTKVKGSDKDYQLSLFNNSENLLWIDFEIKEISVVTEMSDWVYFNGFSVHNLQNIYFVFTGEELTIK